MTKLDLAVSQTGLLSLETKGFYFLFYKYLVKTYGKDTDKIISWLKEYEGISISSSLQLLNNINDFQLEKYGADKLGIKYFIKKFEIREYNRIKRLNIGELAKNLDYQKIKKALTREKVYEFSVSLNDVIYKHIDNYYCLRFSKRNGVGGYMVTIRYEDEMWGKVYFKDLEDIRYSRFLRDLILC